MNCTYQSTNKHLMRKAFERNGDPSPKSILIDEFTDISKVNIMYPVIVKPTDRSGSRGIYKIESPSELKEAIRKSMEEGFEKKVLVEEFAQGQEYSVEAISFQGKHNVLAITQKYTTGAPHFIETGHMEPAKIDDEMLKKVEKVIYHALDSLEIKNSASHSEIKIDEYGEIRIIEIGGRMGGDCIGSDLVYYSTGIDFVKAVIQVACGIEPDLQRVREPISVEVRFIFSEEDIKEMEMLKKTDCFLKLIAYHPENIGLTTDSSNRAGCYLIKREVNYDK